MKWRSISAAEREAMTKGFSPLEIRTRGVFTHSGRNPSFRYVPKALGPSGGAWRTWDRREQKFLSDDELVAIPVEAIFDEEFLS